MTFSTASPTAWKRPRAVLTAFGLAGGLGLAWALSLMLQSESEPGSRIFLNLSLSRLVLLAAGGLAVAILAYIGLRAWKEPVWADARWQTSVAAPRAGAWLRWLSLLVFCLGWMTLFTPSQRFGGLQAIHLRLVPLLAWLVWFSFAALSITLLGKYEIGGQNVRESFATRRSAWWLGGGMLLTGLAVAAVSRWFDFFRPEDYSYGAGVPVQWIQLLIALAAVLLVQYAALAAWLDRFKRPELLICLALWALTAFLWVRAPVPASYFNPGPYLPDNEYHPFSDAALFDLGGQYLLIGQGLNSGIAFDRPVYMQLLYLLHAVAGQDYAAVVNLQSAILALFPVLLYLIGREIAGRPFGLGLAIAGTLRGLNSIAGASLIDLGSQKQMLTDFPAALGVAALLYLVVRWLKRPEENRLFVLWAGGVLGLLSLVRTTAVLLFFPFAVLLILVYRPKWSAVISQPLILLAMMVFTIWPWGIPSGTSMLDVYLQKFRDVIQQRYLSPASLSIPRAAHLRPVSADNPALPGAGDSADLGFVPRHFYHNLLTSFLILPSDARFLDLRTTVKDAFPYWRLGWDGTFAAGPALFLAGQFMLLSFGLGMAWRRAGPAGLAPMLVFLTYQLANSLGRTSGGRFIVPVDWIVLLYYLLGLAELCFLVFEMAGRNETLPGRIPALPSDAFRWSTVSLPRALGVLALFLLIGLTPTLSGNLYPMRYATAGAASVLDQLAESGHLESIGASRAAVGDFLGQPGAVLIQGRALYPRFYRAGRGELDSGYPYLSLAYPRLAFTSIGPRLADGILLPLERSPDFPNASDVLILGCQVVILRHVEALAVFLLHEDGTADVYTRQPAAPLQCPVPAIVCDENRQCRSAP